MGNGLSREDYLDRRRGGGEVIIIVIMIKI